MDNSPLSSNNREKFSSKAVVGYSAFLITIKRAKACATSLSDCAQGRSLQLVMGGPKSMTKVAVKILQGSVVIQTVLGGLTTYPPIANFLWCILCAKNYENWLAVDKVIAKISRPAFLAHPVGTLISGIMTRVNGNT